MSRQIAPIVTLVAAVAATLSPLSGTTASAAPMAAQPVALLGGPSTSLAQLAAAKTKRVRTTGFKTCGGTNYRVSTDWDWTVVNKTTQWATAVNSSWSSTGKVVVRRARLALVLKYNPKHPKVFGDVGYRVPTREDHIHFPGRGITSYTVGDTTQASFYGPTTVSQPACVVVTRTPIK
jgi:hypothetical protein